MRRGRAVIVGALLAASLGLGPSLVALRAPSWAQSPPLAGTEREVLVHETRSTFSHIRIRDRGSRRTLYFVRDSGLEIVETSMDLRAPHLLQVAYTRLMFVSLLYRPQPATSLIVGLGGGAMVRFLNHFFPEVRVDVVDIDPAIVAIAEKYFGTVARPGTRIFTEDAFAYLQRAGEPYDVIYMDAFLKPGGDNDTSGVPLRLKTIAFLRSLHPRLAPGGLVVFNINESPESEMDIGSIRAAFPSVDVFRMPGTGNIVVLASLAERPPGDRELRERARALDGRRDHGFSFERLLDYRGA